MLLKAVTEKVALQQHETIFLQPDGAGILVECAVSCPKEALAQGGVILTFHAVVEKQPSFGPDTRQFLAANNLFGMIYANVDGGILDANDFFLQMLGYTRDEFFKAGIGWNTLTPEAFIPQDMKALQELRDYGLFTPYEKQLVRQDGALVDVLVGPMIGTFAPGHEMVFVLDITERKQFERTVSEGERLFRAMAESSPALIWVCDKDMKVNYANRKLLDYLNCTFEEFAQLNWVDFLHPDDVASTLEFLAERGQHPLANYEFEVRVRRPDGSYRWAISRGGPVITEDGVHLGWAGSVLDIHDRKMAEESLIQYSKQLERSNRELEQFATITSHDLQEPLRKVMLFSDHLRRIGEADLNAEALDDLERIRRSATRMQHLIRDLLDLSRVTRWGEPFQKTDLRKVLNVVLAELTYIYPDAKSRIQVKGDAVIDADVNQMRQMFLQVLDNALKFHLPGRPSHVQVDIHVDEPEETCWIVIVDNGLGIRAEYLGRIFNIFERLHRDKEYSGTGIGLTLVQKIVERHNGSISVSSEPGFGSTFTIVLPVVQESLVSN